MRGAFPYTNKASNLRGLLRREISSSRRISRLGAAVSSPLAAIPRHRSSARGAWRVVANLLVPPLRGTIQFLHRVEKRLGVLPPLPSTPPKTSLATLPYATVFQSSPFITPCLLHTKHPPHTFHVVLNLSQTGVSFWAAVIFETPTRVPTDRGAPILDT